MRKLKYGDGSISRRQRTLKNGEIRRYYEGRIFREGKQISVYGRTQEECLSKLREARKNYPIIPTSSGYTVKPGKAFKTYNDWLDEWMQQFKARKLRESYYAELERRVDSVRKVFGKKQINKIEALEILRFLNSLPQNNSTVKTYDVINGSLQKAEDFGIIKRNPCRAVERPTYETQRRRAFELSEQAAIMQELDDRYSSVFFFLCCTGLRIGEFLALRPDDFDKDRHVIIVDGSLNSKTGIEGKTKTAAGIRKIYYADELLDRFDINSLETYTYNGIKKAFYKVIKKLNIKGISVTHSCRHTFASMLNAVGVNGKIIQRLMGHASVTTTLDVYTDILLKGTSPVYDYILRLKSTLISTLI